MVLSGDRRSIQATGTSRQRISDLAKPSLQRFGMGFCQLADGANPIGVQFPLGGRPHIQQILYGKRIDDFFIIIWFNAGNGIWLFVVTAQFCGNLIVRNADTHRDSQLFLDPRADFLGNGHGAAKQTCASGNIDPAFIQAEPLDLIAVVLKDFPYISTIPHILSVMGRNNN